MWRIFKKYFELPAIERKMFREALWISFKVRLMLRFIPFAVLEKKLGSKESLSSGFDAADTETLQLIKKSIKRASRYSFWRNKCIEQSLTALIMLKQRNIPYMLTMGATKSKGILTAHVWIQSGDFYIVEKGSEEFILITKFYG